MCAEHQYLIPKRTLNGGYLEIKGILLPNIFETDFETDRTYLGPVYKQCICV